MNHYRIECSCGYIIEQCKCPSPSKTVTILDKACSKCQAEKDSKEAPAKDKEER